MSVTKRIEVPASDTFKEVFGDSVIVKNCDEDEQLCPYCHGLGIYGISESFFHLINELPGASTADYGSYPYSKQYIRACPYCQDGVVKVCEHCGVPILKTVGFCLCQDSVAARNKYRDDVDAEKRRKRLEAACELTIDDIIAGDIVLYDEITDTYFDEIDDIVDYYESECSGKYPSILWACTKSMIHFDACSLVENACDYLHEDALGMIEWDDIDRLQDILDEWCKDQICTTTYNISYDRYIRVTGDLIQKLKK